MSAFLNLGPFLFCVRNANRANPYAGSLSFLYLLKHMLPDGHPLEFMYKGLPRNREYPRLLWPCLSTLIGAGVTLASAILTAVLGANGILADKTADMALYFSIMGSAMVADAGLMVVPTVQDFICTKKMDKMDLLQIGQIYAEIEKKWPGFFKFEGE